MKVRWMFKAIVGEVSGTSRLEVVPAHALEFPVDHKVCQGVEHKLREQARVPGNSRSFFYFPQSSAELNMPYCEQFVEDLRYVRQGGRWYVIDGVGFSLRLELPPAMQVKMESFDAERDRALEMGQGDLDSRLDADENIWRLWANLYSSELPVELAADGSDPNRRFREYAGHVVLQTNEITTPRTLLILPPRLHEDRLAKPAEADQDEAARYNLFTAFYGVAVCISSGSYEVETGPAGHFWASWHHAGTEE